MAVLFAKLSASPGFLGASPSPTFAAAWGRFLGLVQGEFYPGAFLSRCCADVSEPRALLNHPFLKLPPNAAFSGDFPRQWHSLLRAFGNPEGTSFGRKAFRQDRNLQILGLVELHRGVGVTILAPGNGQAPWLSSTAERHSSTTPTESPGIGATKKLCSVCNYEKPLRNFQATRSSADGLQSLCRACMATLRAKRSGRPLYHLSLSVEEAWEQARICRSCGQRQEVRDFVRDAWRPDGIYVKCRSCASSFSKSRPHCAPGTLPRECKICGVVKPAEEFYPSSKNRTGLHPYCKSCGFWEHKRWAQKVTGSMLYSPAATKRCPKCWKEQSRSDFYKSRLLTDGLDTYCKECRKSFQKK